MPITVDLRLPRAVGVLTWSGLLPFAAALGAALAWPAQRDAAQLAFIVYGAVILSFLGGTRWGRGIGAQESAASFIQAVIPSLLGFAALLVGSPPAALALLAGGFALCLALDLRDRRWPPRYRRLRLGISAAVLTLHAGWALS